MGFKEQTTRCVREPTLHSEEYSDLEPLPEQAGTEAPTSIATIRQAPHQDPRWRNLSYRHSVDMSLTTRSASKSHGRRAHQHDRSSGLTGRTVARIFRRSVTHHTICKTNHAGGGHNNLSKPPNQPQVSDTSPVVTTPLLRPQRSPPT